MRVLYLLLFLIFSSTSAIASQATPKDTLMRFYNIKGQLSNVVVSGTTIRYRTKNQPNELKVNKWIGVDGDNFLLIDSTILDTNDLAVLEVTTTPTRPFAKGVSIFIKSSAIASFLLLAGTSIYNAHLFRQAESIEEYVYASVFLIAVGSVVSAISAYTVIIWRINELEKNRVVKK